MLMKITIKTNVQSRNFWLNAMFVHIQFFRELGGLQARQLGD